MPRPHPLNTPSQEWRAGVRTVLSTSRLSQEEAEEIAERLADYVVVERADAVRLARQEQASQPTPSATSARTSYDALAAHDAQLAAITTRLDAVQDDIAALAGRMHRLEAPRPRPRAKTRQPRRKAARR